MPELYTTPDINEAIESGKKAFEYGMSSDFGPIDVHTVDAGLTCLRQTNVLTRGHEDNAPTPLFASAEECTTETCCEKGLALIAEHENKPKAATADEAAIDPGTIMLLLQVASLVKKLFGW